MSIKTPKRLVLGLIASLVLAPFAAIAPANAAAVSITTSVPTVGTATSNVKLGANATSTVGFTTGAALVSGDTQTYTNTTVTLVTPAGSTVTLADRDGANSSGTTAAFATTSATTNVVAAVNTTTGAVTGTHSTADVAAGAIVIGTVTITPDVAGTYKVIVTASNGVTATSTIYAADLWGFTADGLSSGVQKDVAIKGVAGPANTVTLKFNGVAGASRLVTVTGSTIASITDDADGTAPVLAASKASFTVSGDVDVVFTVATPAVGTITVNAYKASQPGIYSATPYGTVTITVAAAAVAGGIEVADSTAVLKSGATWAAGTDGTVDDANVLVAATAGTNAPAARASVKVVLAQVAGAITTTNRVTATITGPGSLTIDQEDSASSPVSSGRSVTSTVGVTTETFYVHIYSDGTAGPATVTITVGGFTATKTVTFYGAVASYTVTTNKAHLANDGTTTTDVIRVTALDAAGVKVPSATIYASVGTSTIGTISQSAVTDATGVAKFAATGLVDKFGAVPVTFSNATSAATVTATGSFGVASKRAASITVTADKTSYLPGELMTLTFTAKDANGLGLPNDSYAAGTLLADSAANPLVSLGLTTTPFAGNAALALKAGVVTATAYAPLVEGTLNFTWTVAGTAGGAATTNLAAALLGTKVTLAVTVAKPAAPAPEPVYEKPTLSVAQSAGRVILSGTAVEGEGDIIIYVKRIGTTAWKERAKTLEVAAPGDFNGSIKAPKGDVVIRVKQEGTGLFSNQVIVLK